MSSFVLVTGFWLLTSLNPSNIILHHYSSIILHIYENYIILLQKMQGWIPICSKSIHPKNSDSLTHLWGPDELVIFVTTFQLAVLGSPVNLPLVPLVPIERSKPARGLVVHTCCSWWMMLKLGMPSSRRWMGGQKKNRWTKNIMIKTLYETTYHPKFAGQQGAKENMSKTHLKKQTSLFG